jgi:hypothetical protein
MPPPNASADFVDLWIVPEVTENRRQRDDRRDPASLPIELRP